MRDYFFITARVEGGDREQILLVKPGTIITFNWDDSGLVTYVDVDGQTQLVLAKWVTSIGITKK